MRCAHLFPSSARRVTSQKRPVWKHLNKLLHNTTEKSFVVSRNRLTDTDIDSGSIGFIFDEDVTEIIN